MNITDYSRITILQTAFLGDIALTLPLADAIKSQHPTAEVHFITTPAGAHIAACSGSVDSIHIFDKHKTHKSLAAVKGFAATLLPLKIDCVLSPHRSLRSSLLVHYLHPAMSVGFRSSTLSMVYHHRVNYPLHLHEAERNLALLDAFDDNFAYKTHPLPQPVIIVPEDDTLYSLQLLSTHPDYSITSSVVALAPGSVWPTKRWGTESFVELAKHLKKKGIACIFIGGKEDERLCNRLAKLSGGVSMAGLTTIRQTLALLQKCAAIVTNDSAPTHLAWLAGCPAVTIFGPTSPIFGFAPRGKHDEFLENTEISCRPCSIHGGKQCPLGTHECMKSISALTVGRAVLDILSLKQKT